MTKVTRKWIVHTYQVVQSSYVYDVAGLQSQGDWLTSNSKYILPQPQSVYMHLAEPR